MRLSDAEKEALRYMAVAEQTEKEKVIAGELERDVGKVVEKWRVRLELVLVRPEDRRNEI